MPTPSLTRGGPRWVVLLGLLALAWLVTPHAVPLYDGIGFPDQPYRYVPARTGAAPATTAVVRLKVAGGVNTVGLIANSAEVGPQVSVFAPPRAFAAPGTAPLVVEARPVPAAPPLPPGTLDSNVYAVSFSSAAGPVSLVSSAQPPAVTMRAVRVAPDAPVFEYRASPTASWRELKTRTVGRDVFTTAAPGAGEFVLVQLGGGAANGGGGHTGLYVLLGATVALVAGVLIGVRLLAGRTEAT